VIAPEAGWVTVAVLGKPRGTRGELTAIALSDHDQRFAALRTVNLFGGAAKGEQYQIEELWFHDRTLIFKLAGVDTIPAAEALRGAEVRVPLSERVELDAGEYFHSDLIGCEVYDRKRGVLLGRVESFEEVGGAGALQVGGGLLIPFVKAFCVAIDPAAGRIEVELPAGLEDLNRP
jgi:16S rRNA processing protein RimM